MNQHQRGVRPHHEPGEVRGARPSRRGGIGGSGAGSSGCGYGRRRGRLRPGAGRRCRRQGQGCQQGGSGLRDRRPLRLDGRLRLRLRRPVRLRRCRSRPAERAHPSRGVRAATAHTVRQAIDGHQRRATVQQAVDILSAVVSSGRVDARWYYLGGAGQPRGAGNTLMALELITQARCSMDPGQSRTTSARSGSSSTTGTNLPAGRPGARLQHGLRGPRQPSAAGYASPR